MLKKENPVLMGIFKNRRLVRRQRKTGPAENRAERLLLVRSGKKYKKCHLPADDKNREQLFPSCGPT
jgi:hypothetical protein